MFVHGEVGWYRSTSLLGTLMPVCQLRSRDTSKEWLGKKIGTRREICAIDFIQYVQCVYKQTWTRASVSSQRIASSSRAVTSG